MKVKFITAIYSDLYGTEFGGRQSRKDHYRFSLLSLLKMTDADFLCYTSEREIKNLENFFYNQNGISKEKLRFNVFDLSKIEISTTINEVKNFNQIRKSDRCYEIQYSKFFWFKNEDVTYDYYYWIDAGLSHTGLIPDKYLSGQGYRRYFECSLFNNKFLKNLINKTNHKFLILSKENSRNFWENTVDRQFYNQYDNSVHIIGGLFGGKREVFELVSNLFIDYLLSVIKTQKKLFLEEHILSLMYQNHKELFNTLNFDVWWHEDNYKDSPPEFFTINKSFYKILEELNG